MVALQPGADSAGDPFIDGLTQQLATTKAAVVL